MGFLVTCVHCWLTITWIFIFSCATKQISRLNLCTGCFSPVKALWISLSWTSWQPSLPISAACWGPQWHHNHCYMDISSSAQLCVICHFAQSLVLKRTSQGYSSNDEPPSGQLFCQFSIHSLPIYLGCTSSVCLWRCFGRQCWKP